MAALIAAVAVIAVPGQPSRGAEAAASRRRPVAVFDDQIPPRPPPPEVGLIPPLVIERPAERVLPEPTEAAPVTAPPAEEFSPPAAGSIEEIIYREFGGEGANAVNVADCESSLNPHAVGGNNYGLFQISDIHADDFETFTGTPFRAGWSDPVLNTQYAYKLWSGSGWGPWTCKP